MTMMMNDEDSKDISPQAFNMTQPQITSEIVNSKQKMVLQVERGTFIVPSFDEIWPQAGKDRLGKGSKRMGMEYILEVRIIVSSSAQMHNQGVIVFVTSCGYAFFMKYFL